MKSNFNPFPSNNQKNFGSEDLFLPKADSYLPKADPFLPKADAFLPKADHFLPKADPFKLEPLDKKSEKKFGLLGADFPSNLQINNTNHVGLPYKPVIKNRQKEGESKKIISDMYNFSNVSRDLSLPPVVNAANNRNANMLNKYVYGKNNNLGGNNYNIDGIGNRGYGLNNSTPEGYEALGRHRF
jgi:hypothetical protein